MDSHVDTRPLRLIPPREVQRLTSLSRVTIWRRVRSGDFPRPANLGGRIAWNEADVEAWIRSKCEAGAHAA